MPFINVNCSNCGAAADIDESRDIWYCTACGGKIVYKEEVSKIELTGEGANDLAENGEMFLKPPMDIERAAKTFEKMTEKYPRDYRGWFGLAKCKYMKSYSFGTSMSSVFSQIVRDYNYAFKVMPDAKKDRIQKEYTEEMQKLWQTLLLNAGGTYKNVDKRRSTHVQQFLNSFEAYCSRDYIYLADEDTKERFFNFSKEINDVLKKCSNEENEKDRLNKEGIGRIREGIIKDQQEKTMINRQIGEAEKGIKSHKISGGVIIISCILSLLALFAESLSGKLSLATLGRNSPFYLFFGIFILSFVIWIRGIISNIDKKSKIKRLKERISSIDENIKRLSSSLKDLEGNGGDFGCKI